MDMNVNMTKDAVFQGIAIQLDAGMGYTNCKFVRCNLIFAGSPAGFRLVNNSYENCNWQFVGPAGNVISFLTLMYASGQKDIVERLFETIRKNAAQFEKGSPQNPPTSNTVIQ